MDVQLQGERQTFVSILESKMFKVNFYLHLQL
jgi:hypothetical protein